MGDNTVGWLFWAFAFGYVSAILTLAGVIVGGYLVYITKKESGDGFFAGVKTGQGDAYIAKGEKMDDLEDLDMGADVSNDMSAYDILMKQNERARTQMGAK